MPPAPRLAAMSNVFDHGHAGGGAEQGQQGDTLMCYFHSREQLVGVCAHCLRERLLLLLAAKQGGGGRARVPADGASYLSARPYRRALRRVRTGSIVSVLALGSSLLHHLDSSSSRHHHAHDVHDDAGGHRGSDDDADAESMASLDDSFISIKFEDNGKATWMDSRKSDVAAKISDKASEDVRPAAASSAVVEHVKRRGMGATRWRKQVVGRLLQLARWKRASASSAKAEQQRAKGRGRRWIRSLTHGERAWS